jgi:uncharacterized membrane protein
MPRWILRSSLGLSVLAVGLATYLTVTHYTDPAALACPDSGVINCTLVTTSPWSILFGVPVAVWGLAWAAGMLALCSPWAWRSRRGWVRTLRLAGSAAGAAMVVYLIYVELFRVDALCLWCTAVHITAVALFGVVLMSTPLRARSARPAS